MEKLSSPIDLIKKSVEIFFDKKNFVYFLKVYSPLLIFSFLQLWRFNKGLVSELEKGNFRYFSDKPLMVVWFFLIFVIMFIFGVWFQAASLESILRVVNRGALEFKSTYKKAWGYAFKLFLASLIVGLIIFGGLILLIVPGIIFSIWYFFVKFLIVEKGLGIGEALKKSKELVRGRFWLVSGRIGVVILFSILIQIVFSIIPYGLGNLVLTIFGAIFVLPYFLLYKELQGSSVK